MDGWRWRGLRGETTRQRHQRRAEAVSIKRKEKKRKEKRAADQLAEHCIGYCNSNSNSR